MMLGSRGCCGGYEGRVPTEGDRFQPSNGQFDCDEAYRYDDHRFHQLPSGRQEAGTFRTGVPRHGSIDAIVRPTQLQHCGCPSAAGGWRVPVGSIVEQTWLGISSFTVAAECVEIFFGSGKSASLVIKLFRFVCPGFFLLQSKQQNRQNHYLVTQLCFFVKPDVTSRCPVDGVVPSLRFSRTQLSSTNLALISPGFC